MSAGRQQLFYVKLLLFDVVIIIFEYVTQAEERGLALKIAFLRY